MGISGIGGDLTTSEDDNVLVYGVSRDVNSLGFFGFAYYVENRDTLNAMPNVEKDGKPAARSMGNVLNGSDQPLARRDPAFSGRSHT